MLSGKILAPNFTNELLSRDFFIDKSLEQQVENKIEIGSPILFMPNYVQIIHDFIYNTKPYPTCILLIGTTISGSKASVLLTNPPIYFDLFCSKLVHDPHANYCPGVEYGNNVSIKTISDGDFLSFTKLVDAECAKYNIKNRIYICKKIYNIGDTENNRHVGVRIFFKKKSDMSKMMRKMYRIPEFFLASNKSNFTNLLFINNNKYCGSWMLICDYTYYPTGKRVYTKAKHNFRCEFSKFIKPIDDRSILYGYSLASLEQFQGHNLEITWDIESKFVKDDKDSEDSNVMLHPNNKIFNICAVISDTSQPNKILATIGLFRPKYRGYVRFNNNDFDIMCQDQSELLLAFASVIEYLQPDIMTTYNGNQFDLPLYLLQSRVEGIFEEVHSKCSISTLCDPSRFSKNDAGLKVNKDGYSLWRNVFTTTAVSGIYEKNDDSPKNHEHMRVKSFKLEKGVDLEYHYWNIGVIHLDLYMISKKKYPKSQFFSLSHMLKINKLNIAKIDLPYSEIWKRWDRSDTFQSIIDPKIIESLSEIDKYCKMDCVCTYRLRVKYMILEEKRSMCRYTHLPMEVVIYQADGVKVESGLGVLYSGDNFVYVCDRYHENKKKPPVQILYDKKPINLRDSPHLRYHTEPPVLKNQGAIVDIRTRGKVYMSTEIAGQKLDVPLPVAALDVQSLYPNLMINYNLSLDAIRFNRPQNGDEYTEHYLPDLPTELEYEAPGKIIWIRKHNGDASKFSIVPRFLWKLFNDRIEIKKQLAAVDREKDQLIEKTQELHPKSEFIKTISEPDPLKQDELYEKYYRNLIIDELLQIEARWQTLNAYQTTIKILMNTVYGVMKFNGNIFYCFYIAHIVTKTGRELITFVNSVINKKAYVDYNDTDSAYYHHDIKYYLDIIRKFYIDKSIPELQFRKKMVHRAIKLNITFADLTRWYKNKADKLGVSPDQFSAKLERYKGESMQELVNNSIVEYTGHSFLKMVIEEILFTAQFLAKKKYFGHNHGLGFKENITENELLVKGISYVTRQTSAIQKEFNKQLMIKIISNLGVDCEQILDDIVLALYTEKHDISKYLVSYSYKPNMNNHSVIPFVERMKIERENNPELAHLYRIPDPLEVFRYAITNKDITRTLRGCKKNFGTTDRAEYEEVIRHFGYEIDRDHYLLGLASTYAQFITYKPFDFITDSMDHSDVTKKIKDKYVIPKFNAMIRSRPENIRIREIDANIELMYKTYKPQFINYINTRYPTIQNILMAMFKSDKSSAYLYMLDIAKRPDPDFATKLSPKDIKLRTKPLRAESKTRECKLFLSSESLAEIRDKILSKYKFYISHVESRLEKAIFDYMITKTCPEVDVPMIDDPKKYKSAKTAATKKAIIDSGIINLDELPDLLTDTDIAILSEFETNLKKFSLLHQYYTFYCESTYKI